MSLIVLERTIHTALRARADRRSPLPPHLLTGQRGEDAAFFHLRALGYTVVARRWRSPRLPGDLDLIAWDGPTLIFFEVKTRSALPGEPPFLPAEAAVDPAKQAMLRRMASAWLRAIPQAHRETLAVRFDVLTVLLDPRSSGPRRRGIAPRFQHFANAFPRFAPARSRF